jgi:hypothetical protein
MPKIDPDKERSRLAEFYSQQMDGELEKVAAQAYELTEIAREALRTELARRNVAARFVEHRPIVEKKVDEPQPGDPPPPEPTVVEPSGPQTVVDLRELVTVRKFRDLPEALLAKGSLKSAGIDAVLIDENTVRMDWFWSNLIGGIKLQVEPDDLEAANEILDLPIPDTLQVLGVGDFVQPHCPKCHSLDVAFQELRKPVAYVSAYLGVPIPMQCPAWRCHACGVEWEEDPAPDV